MKFIKLTIFALIFLASLGFVQNARAGIFDLFIPTPANGTGAIATGGSHTCALKTDNSVVCWGNNGNGQLGDNSTTQRLTPVQVHGVNDSGYLTGVAQISAGGSHACVVKTDGTAYCWGYNGNGQLGDNTNTQRNTPVQVHGVNDSGYLTSVSQISVGGNNTCAVKTDGTAYCWGYNGNGQLGDNTNTQRNTPVQVHGVSNSGNLTDVSQITASTGRYSYDYTTCAVKTDGTAYCWGNGTKGQLGDGTNRYMYTPVQVHGVSDSGYLTGVAQISAGESHICAVKTDGTAYCWGTNSYGERGDNTGYGYIDVPAQVHGVNDSGYLTSVSQISDGSSHTCALKTDGSVVCWGKNDNGQIGDNTTTQRNVPTQVSGLTSGVSAIATRGLHTCALKTDGSVVCWGGNAGGQLGDGTPLKSIIPGAVLASIDNSSPTLSDGFEDSTLSPFTVSTSNWGVVSGAGDANTGTYGAKSTGTNGAGKLNYSTTLSQKSKVSFYLKKTGTDHDGGSSEHCDDNQEYCNQSQDVCENDCESSWNYGSAEVGTSFTSSCNGGNYNATAWVSSGDFYIPSGSFSCDWEYTYISDTAGAGWIDDITITPVTGPAFSVIANSSVSPVTRFFNGFRIFR